MKRTLLTGALVCALFTLVSAGPPDGGGRKPAPTPTPTPTPEVVNVSAAVSDGSYVDAIFDGALSIFSFIL